MTVDVISLAVVALLIYLGWRSGAIRQVLRVVAIVAVIVGVPFAAPVIRDLFLGESGRAAPSTEVLSIVVAGLMIYVVIAIGGWFFVKTMRFVSTTLSLVDRAGGAAIGGIKAVILVYLFAMLIVFIEGSIVERDPDNRLALRDGQVTGVVAEYTILAPWQFPDLDELHTALIVGGELDGPPDDSFASAHPEAREFLADEQVRALLDDEELMGWVDGGYFPRTLADKRVRQVLNDDDLMGKLNRADWDATMP